MRKRKTFNISSENLFVLKWQKIHVISNCNTKQNLQFTFHEGEAYSESFQMSKIEFSGKKINCFQSLTSLAKDFTSDGTQGSEYASFE